MERFKTVEVSSWKALLDKVKEYWELWQADATTHPLWYRGQTNCEWSLLPSLLRYKNGIAEEAYLFRDYDDPLPIRAAETGKDWERLFQMQHYNVPTRLLDWTEILGLALFNAVGVSDDMAAPTCPGIFLLDPLALGGVLELPNDKASLSYQLDYLTQRNPGEVPPRAICPHVMNDRLRVQRGRFTLHGTTLRPLEELLEGMNLPQERPYLVRIKLIGPEIKHETRQVLIHTNVSARAVYPDFEGRALALKARLVPLPYRAERDRIREALRKNIEDGKKTVADKREAPNNLASLEDCAMGEAFRLRDGEKGKITNWLMGSGGSILFLSGEAGSGKTNLLLQLALSDALKRCVAFFPARVAPPSGDSGSAGIVMQHIVRSVLGRPPNPIELQAWEELLVMDEVILIIDGLDELGRNKGSKAVDQVVRELGRLVDIPNSRARIIVSCRDHILRRLENSGLLTFDLASRSNDRSKVSGTEVEMEALSEDELRKFITDILGTTNPLQVQRIVEHVRQAGFEKNPMFLKYLLGTIKAHGNIDHLAEAPSPGKAIEEFFKLVLEGMDFKKAMSSLAHVARCMLDKRTDVITRSQLEKALQGSNGRDGNAMGSYIQPEQHHGFRIFTEVSGPSIHPEKEPSLWAFSHQSLREFVLAYAVFEEIINPELEPDREIKELDYEGLEVYGYVQDLMKGSISPVAEAITAPEGKLSENKNGDRNRSHAQRPWNNRVRNLFEAFGMLEDPVEGQEREKVVRTAINLLDRVSEAPPVSGEVRRYHGVHHMTALNIVRCLERIHPSAPRPYRSFIGSIDLRSVDEQRKAGKPAVIKSAKGADWVLHDECPVTSHALRGFHLATRDIRGHNLFLLNGDPSRYDSPEQERVSKCLLGVMERLASLDELPLHAEYLWINSTQALIRWLPWQRNENHLSQLIDLMDKPAFGRKASPQETVLNIFWALFFRGEENQQFEAKAEKIGLGRVRSYPSRAEPDLRRFGAELLPRI